MIRYLQNGVLLLFPFTAGTKYFRYDPVNRLLTMENDPAGAHAASYANARRITTYLRTAGEQFHGAIFRSYKASISI